MPVGLLVRGTNTVLDGITPEVTFFQRVFGFLQFSGDTAYLRSFYLFQDLSNCKSGEYLLWCNFVGDNFLSLPLASTKVDSHVLLHSLLHMDFSSSFTLRIQPLAALALLDSSFGLILASIMVSLTVKCVLESMRFGIITQTHWAQNPVFLLSPKQYA